jgi:hypothetical protein
MSRRARRNTHRQAALREFRENLKLAKSYIDSSSKGRLLNLAANYRARPARRPAQPGSSTGASHSATPYRPAPGAGQVKG